MADTAPTADRTRTAIRRPSAALKPRIHQGLAQDIGISILRGDFASGQPIPGEIAGSETLRVSRTAYREAIRILAAKGLVESRQKAGTLVTERSRWNLLDPEVLSWMLSGEPDPALRDAVFELRMIIEPAAAALAAERRNAADLAQMEGALLDMRDHPPDSPRGAQADEQFHNALFAAGRNELLSRLANTVAASVKDIAEVKRARHIERDTWPDHKALFDSISTGDSQDAFRRMADLLTHARQDVDGAPAPLPIPVREPPD